MDSKQIAGYIASVAAIAFGAAFIWLTPAGLSKDAALGLGIAFATAGFSGFSVTIAVPAVTRTAHEQGRMTGHREAAARTGPPRA